MAADFNLKYRPQSVSDLDLAPLKEGLSKVLKSGRIPHAFLFTGPRGTGKTSAARIVAKSVNCENKSDFEPCNKCEQCRTITAGSNLDVLEIDAASSRGIDDIRDLREKIRLAPSFASFKVYIIDEVHMLTIEAFNALLKTLEEPPEHAIFVLCTTNPEKLPDTIVSRCMRFNFRRATQEEIILKLKKIAKEEKIKIEEKALKEIAKAVKGSFRDANRILEQTSMSGGEVTTEEVSRVLDQTLGYEPEKLLETLLKKDAKAAIDQINQVVEKGGNLQVYTEELLELLRKALLVKIGVSSQEELPSFAFALPEISGINRLVNLFSRAAREAKGSLIPQLPLEMATAEYCFEGEEEKFQVLPQVATEKSKTATANPSLKKEEPKIQALPPQPPRKGKISLGEIQTRWQEVLLGVRPRNHSIEALLRATRPIDFDGKSLVIEVFYQFHKDRLEEERCRQVVEEVVREIFGLPLFLKCILGEKRVQKSPVEEEIEATAVVAPNPGGNGETADEDIVAIAEEIFNGGKS